MSLKKKSKLHLWLIFCIGNLFISCESDNSSQQTKSYTPNYYTSTSQPRAIPKDRIEEGKSIYEGVQDDYTKKTIPKKDIQIKAERSYKKPENYNSKDSYSSTKKRRINSIPLNTRMQQLIKRYTKRNGKIQRRKVAKALNKEGYQKSNGKKFKMKDIPKRAY